jgi:hypothetical protein
MDDAEGVYGTMLSAGKQEMKGRLRYYGKSLECFDAFALRVYPPFSKFKFV